jgi:hypothetical protein
MQCYYVFVNGEFDWKVAPFDEEMWQPRGFYCHRFVLASNEQKAAQIAFERIRKNLERTAPWLTAGSASLRLEVDEICPAPFYKLLKPDNKGHTFYDED